MVKKKKGGWILGERLEVLKKKKEGRVGVSKKKGGSFLKALM